MNIKTSLFYAALTACVGGGFGGGVIYSRHDVDQVKTAAFRPVQCEETDDDRRFRGPKPVNSAAKGY